MCPHRPIALALAAAALAVAGCSEETSEEAAKKDDPTAKPTETTSAPSQPAGALKRKPKIEVSKGKPPEQLQVRDLVTGKGSTAKAGSKLTVNYVGVSFSNGREFDTSFGKPAPFEFQLGASMVIPGWDEGLQGMRVGGRRQLIVPPDKAYGPQGSPPLIGPNETLVFVVDLLGVR